MKIIEPKVELWEQDDPVAHVARCARVCYGSPTEGKSTAEDLYYILRKAGHNSMFRHESIYAIIKIGFDQPTFNIYDLLDEQEYCPYIEYRDDDRIYIATNGNWMRDWENSPLGQIILKHRVTPEEFANTEAGHSIMRYTFHVTTQISTSRELNRVSPNNIAEKSTRYCAEEGTIVRPHWLDIDIAKEFNANPSVDVFEFNHPYLENEADYFMACKNSFRQYRNMIGRGMKKQDARGVLPLDTATEVVYTYSVEEWRHIIELRGSKRAHPNCQIIANMIKHELEELGYGFD